MDKTFTIRFEPLPQGGMLVQVPEIHAQTETVGQTLRDAEEAGLSLIDTHFEHLHRKRSARRRSVAHRKTKTKAKASA